MKILQLEKTNWKLDQHELTARGVYFIYKFASC